MQLENPFLIFYLLFNITIEESLYKNAYHVLSKHYFLRKQTSLEHEKTLHHTLNALCLFSSYRAIQRRLF